MQQSRLGLALPARMRTAIRHPPAWVVYQQGPWPIPHDPIFDFTTTPAEHAWVDKVAARAAALLTRPEALSKERVVGHGDWYCGNLRFTTTGDAVEVASAWDWDSLVCEVEPVIAGMAAASLVDSSISGAPCPTPGEAAAFLADYDTHHSRRLTVGGRWGPGLLGAVVVLGVVVSPWWLPLGVAVGLVAVVAHVDSSRLARRHADLELVAV